MSRESTLLRGRWRAVAENPEKMGVGKNKMARPIKMQGRFNHSMLSSTRRDDHLLGGTGNGSNGLAM